MTEQLSIEAITNRAETLLSAHLQSTPLVLPNIWDVASARIVEEAGFPVVATSSRAIAGVLGLGDDDSSDPDVIFDFISRIAPVVNCPLTADCEAGYGLAPTEFIDRLLEAGAVGCNLEDSDHHGPDVLLEAEQQAVFLAAVRAAAVSRGIHVVINARIDSFIRHVGDERQQLDEAIRRGRLYLEAGADCVYPIALTDRERITEFVASIPGPVNVTARKGGLSISELATLGVRRISFASGLSQWANDQLRVTVANLFERSDTDVLWCDPPTKSD